MHPGESRADRNLRLFDTKRPVVMVTGSGAPRVGRRITEYFVAEHFDIVFHANSSTEQAAEAARGVESAGGRATVVTGEVQSESKVVEWLQKVHSEFGRIDVLVNAAAIWDPTPLEQATAEDYRRNFEVNALGTALLCQHFGLAMTRQPSGGAIINIGDWAVRRPYRDFAAYFPSKAAVVTITESMAVELGTRNPRVRVNAVLPGPVKLSDSISPDHRQKLIDECLLQREGTSDDVAQAAVFLATSPFVSGVCIPVDGGRSIYAGPSSDPVAHPSQS